MSERLPGADVPAEITDPPAFVRTQAEVAEAFSVAKRTVQRWIRDGCPGRGKRGYDLRAIRTWQAAHRDADTPEPEDPTTVEAIANAKARKARADADRAELDVRIRTQQLELLEKGWMSTRHVQHEWDRRIAAARQAFLLLPRAAAREGFDAQTPAELEAVLERWVDQILADLASDDLVERIRAHENALRSGVKVGRGRGRPKGAKGRRSST